MDTREFHIGDILSVTTGALVSPRHVGGVYDLLGFMTGEPLMTHQLPRASRECEPSLRAQFPDLACVEVPSPWPDGDPQTVVLGWLAEQVERYGETRQVEPLPPEDHTRIDPISELRMMRPDLPIVAVVDDGKGG